MSDIEDIEKAAQDVVDNVRDFFRGLLRKYWYLLVLLAIGLAGAFVGIILVILTFLDNTGVSAWHFNDFSVGAIVLICVLLILWILLLVALPSVGYFGIIAGIFWWKLLSDEDKSTLKIWMKEEDKKEKRKNRMKHSSEGGGFTFFINVIFLIIVFAQGNWWTHFEFLPVSYFVITYLSIFIWLGIIAAVGGVIVLILWLSGKIWK